MKCRKCQSEIPETGQCPTCKDSVSAGSIEQASPPPDNQISEAGSDEAVPTAANSGTQPPSDSGSAAKADDRPQGPPKNKSEQQAAPPKNKENRTASSQGKARHEYKHNNIGQVVTTENGKIEVTNVTYQGGERQQDPKKPLSELIKPLSPFSSRIPVSSLDGLDYYSSRLYEEGLLLLSCLNEEIAMTAAYSLIQQLEGKKLQIGFGFVAEEGRQDDLYRLLLEYEKETESAIILANMFSPSALPALDSLVSTTLGNYITAKSLLNSNNLRLICIADPVEIDKILNDKTKDLSLAQWRLPFLKPLLQTYYPDNWDALETQLQQQRDKGKWKRSDLEFHREVRDPIRSQSLSAELARREATSEPVSPNSLVIDEDPVAKTVLYVATYFPDLSVKEFDRVVSLLLGERTMMVPVKTHESAPDGTTKIVEREEEKRLIELWQNAPPDKKIKDCGLVSRQEPPKIIKFVDSCRNEEVRRQLEEEEAFFLGDRFRDVQRRGLLFDPSDRIAKNVVNLYLETLASDPESYGVEWIVEIVLSIDSGVVPPQRVANLIRGMLERPELAQQVERCFNHLMVIRRHGLVLEMVKRLRLTKGFKDINWLKRLLNESDETTRQQTYAYLYSEASRMGFGIYELLEIVESWLPRDDAATYSFSELYALQLLIEYCMETTSRFKHHHYGLWPSRYPLFAAQDEATARQHLRLLTRWLFHPSLICVFDGPISKDDSDYLLGRLLTEWFFIIKGHHETVQVEEVGRATDDLLQWLLEEIIAQSMAPARKGAQRALIDCWQEYMDILLQDNRKDGSVDRKLSRERSWRRNLIYRVLKQFRELQRKYQTASQSGYVEPAGRN